MTTRLRIRTPSRLHFGLLGWGPHSARQFGGVGLMVEKPGLEILVEAASQWDAVGPLAERSLEIAQSIAKRLNEDGFPVGPLRLTNLSLPRPHVGLGVGTQLSLALARALTEMSGRPRTPVETLARLTGRGRRSGIGIHGFSEGGFLVDAGRRADRELPTRLIRLSFPASWSILLVVPEHHQGLHGADELNAFRALPLMPETLTNQLCRLVLLGLLPAVLETDLKSFGSSLARIQQIVGSIFAPVQGGRFSHSTIELIGQAMTEQGLHGVGQSSWGPTLYAFCDQDEPTRETLRTSLIEQFSLNPENIFWTHASAAGATMMDA